MKKLLYSVMTIGIATAMLGAGTFAYFSDVETSTGNTFTAGVIDLEVDCDGDTIFAAQDDPLPEIFDYLPINDMKPGDDGEVTISLHLKGETNPADLSMEILALVDDGGIFSEPEEDVDSGNTFNDISNQVFVFIWIDMDAAAPGDNIYQVGETILFGEPFTGVIGNWETLRDLFINGELDLISGAIPSTTYYIGFQWWFNTAAGNEYQGDFCTFDIAFYANQIGAP